MASPPLRFLFPSSSCSSSSSRTLCASQRTFFSSSPSSFSPHARSLPSNPYRNRFTAFFFTELNKGFFSPWVLIGFGILSSAVMFKLVEWWSAPERARQRLLTPRGRVPMKAEHEAVWGFGDARRVAEGGGEGSSSRFSAPSSPPTTPGAALFDPAVAVAESDALLQRPRLIHTELQHTASPLSSHGANAPDARTQTTDGGADEVVIMEMPEYDRAIQEDTYIRSLHYIPLSAHAAASHSIEEASSVTDDHERRKRKSVTADSDGSWFSFFSTRAGRAVSSSSSTPTTDVEGRSGRERGMDQYFRFMPGEGKEHMHGMVKCKRGEDSLDSTGDILHPHDEREEERRHRSSGLETEPRAPPCVPYAGDLSRESGRKLLLTLGPLHILQDPNQGILPFRFSMVKHPEIRVLVIGLREGSVPRWLSTAYPFFTIDVVEPDVSLLRLAKDFFGFQTHTRLRVVPTTATRFLVEKSSSVETAHTAAERTVSLRSLFIPWKSAPVTRKSVSQQFRATTSSSTAMEDGSLPPMEDPRPYDLILVDAIDPHGNLPSYVGRLEFIQQIRQVLSPTGVVGVLLPNRQPQHLYHTIQHWRMGFQGRSLLLAHCRQEPVTMMMSFQDEGGRGQPTIGTLRSAEDLRDILRSHLTHYGPERVPLFDLTEEVESGGGKGRPAGGGSRRTPTEEEPTKKKNEQKKRLPYASLTLEEEGSDFFKILVPDRRYEPEDYLPGGHPYVLAQRRHLHQSPSTTSPSSSSFFSRRFQEDDKDGTKTEKRRTSWWGWWKSA